MSKSVEQISKTYLNINDSFYTYDNPAKLTRYEYNFIIKTFFVALTKAMVEEGKIFALPLNLGSIGIKKRPTVGRGYFDYELYKREGIKLWKKNLHSDRFAASIIWDQTRPRFNLPMYTHIFKLNPCRDLTRHLSNQIRQNNTINKYYDY